MKMQTKKTLVVVLITTISANLLSEEQKIGGRTWSYDLEHGDAIIKGVTPKTGDIKIPPAIGDGNYPVTSIRQGAFSRCDGLTSVTIPDSVTYIGERAFEGCSGLVSVTIPQEHWV